MIFKVIYHFLLNRTQLITGSSNITSIENLAEITALFGIKMVDFLEFILQLNITPLEHYPILASNNLKLFYLC